MRETHLACLHSHGYLFSNKRLTLQLCATLVAHCRQFTGVTLSNHLSLKSHLFNHGPCPDQDAPSHSTKGHQGEHLSVDVLEMLESLYWTVPDLCIIR